MFEGRDPSSTFSGGRRGEAAELGYSQVRACATDQERQEDHSVRAARRLPQFHRGERRGAT